MMQVLNARGVFGIRLEEVASTSVQNTKRRLRTLDAFVDGCSYSCSSWGDSRFCSHPVGPTGLVTTRGLLHRVPMFSVGLYGLYGVFLLKKATAGSKACAAMAYRLRGVVHRTRHPCPYKGTPLQAGPPLMVLFALIARVYLTRSKRVAQIYGPVMV